MKDATVHRLNALDALDAEYTAAVNAAVEEDRDDLIQQLVADYPVAVQQLMTGDAA
ncbi:hypothetical protein [Pseudonocardia sp. GCM10023141]|uniref:hypothetical protein n=1 Tax=Pseudonocardia sp. GCM10023141 TaxID=3252653 RepID=UPI00361A7775